jgi:hypothetical protein
VGARGAAQAYECAEGRPCGRFLSDTIAGSPRKAFCIKSFARTWSPSSSSWEGRGSRAASNGAAQLSGVRPPREGFVRYVCQSCGDELWWFSCKGRGFASCCARRMSDTAARFDRVLPMIAYRQWVLAYPRRLRLACARSRAAAESATIFLRESSAPAQTGRREGAARGSARSPSRSADRASSSTFIITPCCPTACSLGRTGRGGLLKLERPTREDLGRAGACGSGRRDGAAPRVARRSLWMRWPGYKRGAQNLPLGDEPRDDSRKLAAFLEGFLLQAGTHVHERDREGLEHLLRYALRPPLSLDRPADRGRQGGDLLRKPLYDGTTAIASADAADEASCGACAPAQAPHQPIFWRLRGAPASSAGDQRADQASPPPLRACAQQRRCASMTSLATALRDELRPSALGPPPCPNGPGA